MKFSLAAKPPFNFLSVVRSHGWSALAPFVWDADTGILQRVEQLQDGKVIAFAMSHHANGIAIQLNERLTAREKRELSHKIAWMFSFDLDLNDFYSAVAQEPRLAHVKQHAHGRFLRSSTVWEDVVKVMMTTNIQWSGTKRLTRVLVETFGTPMENPESGKSRPSVSSPLKILRQSPISNLQSPFPRAFPTAASIARSRESRLRKLGLGYRSPYLLNLARGVVSGKYDLESFKNLSRPTDDLRKDLLALPGIGPYAAATMLMLLGRYEYLGIDTEAVSAVSRGFFNGGPVTAKQVQETFAHWGKFQAIAYWFWDWETQFAQTAK